MQREKKVRDLTDYVGSIAWDAQSRLHWTMYKWYYRDMKSGPESEK